MDEAKKDLEAVSDMESPEEEVMPGGCEETPDELDVGPVTWEEMKQRVEGLEIGQDALQRRIHEVSRDSTEQIKQVQRSWLNYTDEIANSQKWINRFIFVAIIVLYALYLFT